MATERFNRVAELFEEARSLPAAQRRAFLESVSGGEEAMLHELLALLEHHDRATASLNDPASPGFVAQGILRDAASNVFATPDSIGRYRILRKLAEGGMGIVYLAEQDQPRREVALKVIKPGMDSRAVIARFEQERQALAVLDHPGIAKVLDAGTTDRGLPYFVMEYVDGESITDYSARHGLDLEERLELFIRVCEAVQHAHMKGVIHRDLKPSNILVVNGHPKIIDFGIAKALNQRLTERTILTEQGQLIGTPEYMSPEQADVGFGAHADIDTRTDVYSLGVILYELLTDSLPFDSLTPRLRERTFSDIQRIIREVEPPRPSAIEPRLQGDLDWIVTKCLEKDRDRRYATANALVMDLRRHLSNEPISARPPSMFYIARKFARRNRALVCGTGLAATFMLMAIVGTSTGLVRARAAEAEARKSTEELQQVVEFQAQQLGGVDVPLMGVRMRLDLIERTRNALGHRGIEDADVDEHLQLLENVIAGVNFTDAALAALDESVLARALEAVSEQFGDQPLVEARLLISLSATYREIGLLAPAEEPLRRSLAIRQEHLDEYHPDVLWAEVALGDLLRRQSRFAEAEPYLIRALERFRRTVGDDHEDTLYALSYFAALLDQQGRYDECERYLSDAIERSQRVLDDEHTLPNALAHNMAELLRKQGRFSEAESFLADALERARRINGDEHSSTLTIMHAIGGLLEAQGKLREAEIYLGEVLERRRQTLGSSHPHTLVALNAMGHVLESQGQLAEAVQHYDEALASSRLVLGKQHSTTLTIMNNLGLLLRELGRLDEAEPHLVGTLRGFQDLLGKEHPSTLTAMNNVGLLMNSLGRYEEAKSHYLTALEVRRRISGEDHPSVLSLLNNIGFVLRNMDDLEGARAYWRESLDGRRRVFGDDHPNTLLAISHMGMLLRLLGELEGAERLGEEAVRRARNVLDADHWRTGLYLSEYGKTLAACGRFEEAERLLAEAIRILTAAFGEEHYQTVSASTALTELYEQRTLARP